MMSRTFQFGRTVLVFCWLISGPNIVFAQEPSQPCSNDCETKAVDLMLDRIQRLIQALDETLAISKQNLASEQQRSSATSYRRQSAKSLKSQLPRLIVRKADEITDQLVRTVRADKPNDTVGVSYLSELYWNAVESAVTEVDSRMRAENEWFALLATSVAATESALNQLRALKQGLESFKVALAKRTWRTNPTDLAAFFASDAFKERVDKLSENVGKLQKALAEPAPGKSAGQP